MQDVWFYVAKRPLKVEEVRWVESVLADFTAQWAAHGSHLDSSGELLYDQVLMLHTGAEAQASGCSIDKSVHFVREISAKLGVDFFNRTLMPVLIDNQLQVIPFDTISEAYESRRIDDQTPVLNTLTIHLEDFRKTPTVPFAGSAWSKVVRAKASAQ